MRIVHNAVSAHNVEEYVGRRVYHSEPAKNLPFSRFCPIRPQKDSKNIRVAIIASGQTGTLAKTGKNQQ